MRAAMTSLKSVYFNEEFGQLSIRGKGEDEFAVSPWPMIRFGTIDDAARAAASVREALNNVMRRRPASVEIKCECCVNAVELDMEGHLKIVDGDRVYFMAPSADDLIGLHVALLDVVKNKLARILDGADDDYVADDKVTFNWERP